MKPNQNINLYQLGQDYQSALSGLYDPETGEVDEAAEAALNALAPAIEAKCVAVASYIKKLEAEKREIDFYYEEILKREAAYEKEIDRLHTYLKTNMERVGITEVKSNYFTLRIRKNPYSTEIFDESQLPDEFLKTREVVKVEVTPDKQAIKEAVLQTGVQIPGASVVQKTKLEILTDKL